MSWIARSKKHNAKEEVRKEAATVYSFESPSFEQQKDDSSLPSSPSSYHTSGSSDTNSELHSPRRPRAGSSTKKLDIPDVEHQPDTFNENNHVVQDSHEGRTKIQWLPAKGETLSVRSLDYQKSRRKSPSLGEMYECILVDFVNSPCRLPNMSSRVELPDVSYVDDHQVKTWDCPDLFVVSLSLPRDPIAGKDDGKTYTITMYFRMKQNTRDILALITSPDYDTSKEGEYRQMHPNLPAVRLFNDWCRLSPNDPQFQGRFKFITSSKNIADLGLPSWITRWDGKPLLIKRTGKTGFLYQQENCLEMEINFHPFPWAAKQAIQYFREHVLDKLLLTFGFVIEGRTEDELPEVLIGLCQLCFPKAENAMTAEEFFDNNVVRMKSLHTGELVYDSDDDGDDYCEDHV